MTKQEFYRKEYQKLNEGWTDSLIIYRSCAEKLVGADTKLLDIGCGHGDFLKPVHDKTPFSYGLDPDADALEKNNFIKHKTVGTADALPFADNFFDVVISAWVMEHLKNPKKTFQEIHRVLKPGGKVLFLTPNAWNYNIWLIRLVPERFHDFFTRKLYGRQEHDTYPKQYKINTPRTIEKILPSVGFNKVQLILNGDPSYISFNKPLFIFACGIEKLLNLRMLNSLKVHLIGTYEK